MKNSVILRAILFLAAGIFIFTACHEKKDNPVAPEEEPTPVYPTVLKINYSFMGSALSTNSPLIFQIYTVKGDMTNQNNPLYSYKMAVSSGFVAITNVPEGTYYLLYYKDEDNSGTLDTCFERFMIHTNFNWWEGQPVDATPVSIPGGQTTTINLDINYGDLFTWAPYGC